MLDSSVGQHGFRRPSCYTAYYHCFKKAQWSSLQWVAEWCTGDFYSLTGTHVLLGNPIESQYLSLTTLCNHGTTMYVLSYALFFNIKYFLFLLWLKSVVLLFCSKQERLFYQLVFLFRHANGDVQNATRDALLRLNVCLLLLVYFLCWSTFSNFCYCTTYQVF